MDSLGQNAPMNIQFAPNEYRSTMAMILLSQSQNMNETCLMCFNNQTQWVMCKFCRRHAHIICIPGKEKKSLKEWELCTAIFVCPLCSVKPRKWMYKM